MFFGESGEETLVVSGFYLEVFGVRGGGEG